METLFGNMLEDDLPPRLPKKKPASTAKKQIYSAPASILPLESPTRWVAKTFRVRQAYVQTIKNIAYWQRRSIQDVMDKALTLYLQTIPENDKITR